MVKSVTRYVITYRDHEGTRRMVGAAQGRNTYAEKVEATEYLGHLLKNNSPDTLTMVFGTEPLFSVRECPCYPNHFDPMQTIFDD